MSSIRNCAGEIIKIIPASRCPTLTPLSCGDPFTILIQAILNLKETYGSTLTSIFNESNTLCENLFAEENDAFQWLTKGLERGLFRWGSTVPTYMINANMTHIFPGNEKYWRCPGVSNSFYKCAQKI